MRSTSRSQILFLRRHRAVFLIVPAALMVIGVFAIAPVANFTGFTFINSAYNGFSLFAFAGLSGATTETPTISVPSWFDFGTFAGVAELLISSVTLVKWWNG